MASIIRGFEYDIFISYRQKDNKYDGWVTEFVDNLKGELDSMFKDEVSVYFDINPSDYLLESYDVDASLKDKLKCLIFIPIISRTYCDPKSFAWEHEFKAFVELASRDQFGLKVKLPNGNVANRLLPVQIHDLYPEDKTAIEKELGGVLRAIEFIYKEPGVNRPLTPTDDKETNLNKTFYRNQINKIANAIDEVIHGLRTIQINTGDRNILSDHKAIITTNEGKAIEKSGVSGAGKYLKKWFIAGAATILLMALIFGIFKIIQSKKQADDIANLEKSIAVLPFINDSPDQENIYFINGIMDEILNNLQKIKDFRVVSRTSTEQYRGANKPPIPKIAKDLGVNYIVEGSGQKYGSTFRLRIQLIAAKNEKHLWGESYEQEIRETKDIFKIQSQVAQEISEALKSTITPGEKRLIERISTSNLTAYDFYQRGEEELGKSSSDNSNKEQSLKSAEELFNKALLNDSTFALAYLGLADVYIREHFYDEYYSDKFLDSVLILANRALSYDDHLPEGYYFRAIYYSNNGNIQQAIKEFDKALKYNPNYWQVYYDAANLIYLYSKNNKDFIKGLEYAHKAVSLNHGKQLADQLRNLGAVFSWIAGFPEKARYYYDEAFRLDGDSNSYYLGLSTVERAMRNYEKSIELLNKSYACDSAYAETLAWLAYDYYMLDKSKESLKYVRKLESRVKELVWVYYSGMKRIGYVYWQNGHKKEAKHWFNEQILVSEEALKMSRYYSIDANYDLAAVYAFLGDKRNSYINLKEVAKMNVCPLWLLSAIKVEPLFNSIRNESKFQEIVKELESKYQAEHERVRKWLVEQGQL